MPPKAIVDREEVLMAAVSLARRSGLESVNARSLAERLGCSTKPLFRIYSNMEELKADVFTYINQYCSVYLKGWPDLGLGCLGMAIRYVSFAENEPAFFKALFMNHAMSPEVFTGLSSDEELEPLLVEVSAVTGADGKEALSIVKKMWLLAHGIASIAATNTNAFPMEEALTILADAFKSFAAQASGKGGEK